MAYSLDTDSLRGEKPQGWPEARYTPRAGERAFDLNPDGNRLALAPIRETQSIAQLDRVVFVSNFFDELRRIAPVAKR